MKKNLFKMFAVALVSGLVCYAPMTAVYAENSISTGTVETVDDTAKTNSTTVDGAGDMPSSQTIFEQISNSTTTIEDVGDKVVDAATSTADQIRRVMCIVCVCAFVIGAAVSIFGAISKKGTIFPGVITMIVAVVAFGLIYNAPTIVAWGATLLQ